MIITCPNCETQYDVDASAIGPRGRVVRCLQCKHKWREEPIDAAPPEAPRAPQRPAPTSASKERLSSARAEHPAEESVSSKSPIKGSDIPKIGFKEGNKRNLPHFGGDQAVQPQDNLPQAPSESTRDIGAPQASSKTSAPITRFPPTPDDPLFSEGHLQANSTKLSVGYKASTHRREPTDDWAARSYEEEADYMFASTPRAEKSPNQSANHSLGYDHESLKKAAEQAQKLEPRRGGSGAYAGLAAVAGLGLLMFGAYHVAPAPGESTSDFGGVLQSYRAQLDSVLAGFSDAPQSATPDANAGLPSYQEPTEPLDWTPSDTTNEIAQPPISASGLLFVEHGYDLVEHADGPSLEVWGRVANNGLDTMRSPAIEIVTLDASGAKVQSWLAWPELDRLAPGASAPFSSRMMHPLQPIDAVELRFIER